MKVILLTNVKNLGQKGDVKETSEGYFRNFLFPNKLAILAESKQLTHIQAQKDKALEKLESFKESALSVMERVNNKSLTIKESASENGKLYRSITKKIISEALNQQLKVDIADSKIELMDPIKQIGTYQIKLNLFKGIEAEIILNVELQ